MNIHALVEGPSERAFLELWARRLLQGHSIKVYPHQGKGALPADPFASPDPKNRALLHQLPSKLRAFADSLNPETDRVVVIVDADGDDCVALTREIVRAIDQFAPRLLVAVRIAIEETEAFYLGDQHALRAAFPDSDLELVRNYEPDSICGTWELFGRVIGDSGGNKVAWAEAMGRRLTVVPARNRSPSFRALCRALRHLATPPPEPTKRRKRYVHRSKRIRRGAH